MDWATFNRPTSGDFFYLQDGESTAFADITVRLLHARFCVSVILYCDLKRGK